MGRRRESGREGKAKERKREGEERQRRRGIIVKRRKKRDDENMIEEKLAIEWFLGGQRVHTKCGFLEQYRLRTSEAEGLQQPTLQLDWMRLITPEISLITRPPSKFEHGWKFETHEFGCSLYKLVLFQPGFPDLLIR